MWTYQKAFEKTETYDIIHRYFDTDEPLLFFDIETTGFHRDFSKLVSISMLELSKLGLNFHFYFNSTGKEEASLLEAVSPLLASKHLVSFNGDAFDIPYLLHKFKVHNLQSPLTVARNLDLMKVSKEILHLDSYKLKNIETALGILRTDTLSGLDCIDAYKLFLDTGDQSQADLIACHNEEDTLNLMTLLARLLEHNSTVVERYRPHYYSWQDLEINLVDLRLQGDFAIFRFEPDRPLNIQWYDKLGHIIRSTSDDFNVERLEITLPVQKHDVDGFDLYVGTYLKGNPGSRVLSVDGRPLFDNLAGILRQLEMWMGMDSM